MRFARFVSPSLERLHLPQSQEERKKKVVYSLGRAQYLPRVFGISWKKRGTPIVAIFSAFVIGLMFTDKGYYEMIGLAGLFVVALLYFLLYARHNLRLTEEELAAFMVETWGKLVKEEH